MGRFSIGLPGGRMLTALVVAVGVLAGAGTAPVTAADLSLKDNPYDDPRYANIYGRPHAPPPPAYVAPKRRYSDERPYRDEHPFHDERRYAERQPYPPAPVDRCLPTRVLQEVVRDRLIRGGWRDFVDVGVNVETIEIEARDSHDIPYLLSIERCGGRLVDARPLERRRFGPYAGFRRRAEGPRYRY